MANAQIELELNLLGFAESREKNPQNKGERDVTNYLHVMLSTGIQPKTPEVRSERNTDTLRSYVTV